MWIVYKSAEIAACIIETFIYIFVLNNLVAHKNENINKRYITVAAALMLFCGLLCNMDVGVWNVILSWGFFAVYLIYGFITLDANKKEVFIIATITHVVMGILSLSTCYIISMVANRPVEEIVVPGSGMFRIYLLLISHLTAMFVGIAVVQWYKKSKIFLQIQEWNWLILEYIIVTILLTVSMLIWMQYPDNDHIMIFTCMLDGGLIMIFIVTFCMMCRSARNYRIQTEYEKIMGSISTEQTLLEQQQKEYEQMQIFRHDLKHYLGTAVAMAQKNECGELSNYLQDIMHEHVEMGNGYIALNNPIIEAVINTKIGRMKELRIPFEIVLAEHIAYTNATVAGVILSNIIDNAIEAAVKCEERERSIQIISKHQRGYVVFEISNSITESVQKNNPKLKTTKQNKKMHGLGLRSVRKMLEEEKGLLIQYERDMHYITEIYLPVMPKNG